MTMKTILVLSVVGILLALSGCTIVGGTSIVTGIPRDPILPEQVRIYRIAPDDYEEIAIVTASAGHDFKSNESLINSTIQRLKEEAAKLGANGVILSDINERDAPRVTTSHGSVHAYGEGTSVSATGRSTSVDRGDSYSRISGLAIYVSQED